MKLPRLAIPVIAVLVIIIAVLVIAVLAGATTTALVAARAQPSAPSPAATAPPAQVDQSKTPTPKPAPTTEVEVLPKQALELTDPLVPKPVEKNFEPKSTPKAVQDRGPKGNRVPPGPAQTESSQAVTRAGEASGKDSAQGEVYTWEDGDRTMRAVLQEDLTVQDQSATTSNDVVVAGKGKNSIVRKQGKQSGDTDPVFQSESGGGLMTLPGGVMLALDPEWDQAAVDKFFAGNDIPADQVTPLEFLDNGFFVETDPGFPSLELANSLAKQDGVVVSSPNWWREVEAK